MVSLNHVRLDEQLTLHEGLRLIPYDDATGLPVKPGQPYKGKLTTGIGRNLDGNPLTVEELAYIGHNARERAITREQAIYLLRNDVQAVIRALDRNIPWWQQLDEVRARVLVDMCFNMGIKTFLTFKNTLTYVKEGKFNNAASGMANSLWYKQVGERGERLTKMMRTGKDWVY